MSGIILFSIGAVGIYVGNIFVQTKNRPLYIVRDTFNEKKENNKRK